MLNGSLKKSILIFIIVLITAFIAGFYFFDQYFDQLKMTRIDFGSSILEGKEDKKIENEASETTILLMGTDKSGYRTDSMLAVNVNFETNTVSLFSIPRDYRITLNSKVQELINHHSKYIKLTELHSYAKVADYESPASLTASAVEELVGFRFDHIVLFNLKAFREVVDALGGLEVNVPSRLYYEDPYQDLYIDLYPGLQTLTGRQAEGLVRFRKNNFGGGYGDFNRMEVQQYVLKEFVKKLVSVDSALNANQLFDIAKENVQTDADLSDLVYLLSRFGEIDFDRIYSHTLPGYADTINGAYYYIPPENEELIEFVDDTLKTDRTPTLSSKDYPIVILNGSGKNNRATMTKEVLEKDGYQVAEIGTSNYDQTMKTKIIVPDQDLGKDLQGYFNEIDKFLKLIY